MKTHINNTEGRASEDAAGAGPAEGQRDLSARDLDQVQGGVLGLIAGAVGFVGGAAGGYYLLKKAGYDWDYRGR